MKKSPDDRAILMKKRNTDEVKERVTGSNADAATVDGFGHEWSKFDQSVLTEVERITLFERYFRIFPWDMLPDRPVGFDLGCGSGRWAQLVAPRVGELHCIDPSIALAVAQRNLAGYRNCHFHQAAVDSIPLPDASQDFGYSLGVLHHIPDTQAGIEACVQKLKPGAPLLVYLYYAFDGRPVWFRALWRCSDLLRRGVAKLPKRPKFWISQLIAAFVYWPLARLVRLAEAFGVDVEGRHYPLSAYRNASFYTMRTDALDRFGTRLEKRFTRGQLEEMMKRAGLERIVFADSEPFWCAVGFRRARS